jgi:hypothetical protein
MDQSFEIRSSVFPHDMSRWCSEKMSSVVLALARIAEVGSDQTVASEATSQAIRDELCSALYDATKMLAFSCGAQWEPSDRDMILENGVLGYQELQARYGQRAFSLVDFINRFRELLAGERSPNRTLMHDLLSRASFEEPLLRTLEDELDRVTMGEADWEEFVPRALGILEQVQEKAAGRQQAR